jgi:hypothetical protein
VRGRPALLVASTGGLALLLFGVFTWSGTGGTHGDGAATMVDRRRIQPSSGGRSAGTPAVVRRPAPGDAAADQVALAYLRDADRRGAAHVKKVIWTPPILRVYTDLPGSAANSRTALLLCATGAAFLDARGRAPIVFVHARERDGYPVVANKMDEDDDCRLNRVP